MVWDCIASGRSRPLPRLRVRRARARRRAGLSQPVGRGNFSSAGAQWARRVSAGPPASTRLQAQDGVKRRRLWRGRRTRGPVCSPDASGSLGTSPDGGWGRFSAGAGLRPAPACSLRSRPTGRGPVPLRRHHQGKDIRGRHPGQAGGLAQRGRPEPAKPLAGLLPQPRIDESPCRRAAPCPPDAPPWPPRPAASSDTPRTWPPAPPARPRPPEVALPAGRDGRDARRPCRAAAAGPAPRRRGSGAQVRCAAMRAARSCVGVSRRHRRRDSSSAMARRRSSTHCQSLRGSPVPAQPPAASGAGRRCRGAAAGGTRRAR